jgi:NADPH:quinone reductase-like Zn-dependent oxidoreductase
MMSCSRLSLVASDCVPLTLGPNTFAGGSIKLLSGVYTSDTFNGQRKTLPDAYAHRDQGTLCPRLLQSPNGRHHKPVVERVYPLGDADEALRHLIEDRPFGKVVLAG